MKIKHVNGTFWKAENDCWTHAECAATEYKSFDDVPHEIEDLKIAWDLERIVYYDDDDEAVASSIN